MTPESVGVPSNRIVLGKHSGRHALAQRFAELGARLSPAEIEEVYARFTALADRKKRIYDQDLLSLLPQKGPRRAHEPRAIEVERPGSELERNLRLSVLV